VPIVLEPLADKRAPRSPYDARFSLQYSLAARLTRGSLGAQDYRLEAIGDPQTLALAACVTHTPWRGDVPSPFAGRVVIRLADGRELRGECPFPPGTPENPLTPDAVLAKFRANATPALGEAADALAASLLDLAAVPDVRTIFNPLAFATTPTTPGS
jgi:2-methylcitrate dehydratase PrpD